ncbi:MAG: TIGR04190 family B12-binding domain/radical SAM domain protein [Candidatus Dormibacteraeota bacterium]|nr:TIGR04190 family B12-binding domain/radical SAM domain protein [Candidatus Dormibacteraeota bacterium]
MSAIRHGAAAKAAADRVRRAWRRVFEADLVLLHAPSVWDFRKEVILQGPLADVIPSTDEFEMYPIGLTSIAAYLELNHYNVRILNVAYRMLRDPDYDVPAHLRHLHAPVFGIDLHWLPHAHGALGLASLVKQVHPEAKVLVGGLSATYFHRELIENPAVDFVLRGDSTEEPCRQLLQALRDGTDLDGVANLTWKRADRSVVVNPLAFVPANLDWLDVPAYDFLLHAVFKYRSLADFVPYAEWLQHPSTMVLNARGCPYNCSICGGSRSGYEIVAGRARAAYRSPERLVADMRRIATFSKAPIFMVHDPRVGGVHRAKRIFELVKEARIPNELTIELFYPAGPDFFAMVRDATRWWSLEITIESPDPQIRKVNGKFPVANEVVEETIAAALDQGCEKLDLFFMVGLPRQTPADALATVDYCRHLVERFQADKRLQFYVAPLGPFLDPGSRGFEQPELGYHRRFTTLEEHRRALLGPTWREMLSYETDWMTRAEIVETTYQVAEGINSLKFASGLIDAQTHDTVVGHIAAARDVLSQVDDILKLPVEQQEARLRQLKARTEVANTATMNGSQELKWHSATGFRVSSLLVRHLLAAFPREAGHGWARLRGHYDTAVASVDQLAAPKGFVRSTPGEPVCEGIKAGPG